MSKVNDLFGKPLTIINVGLEILAASVKDQNIPISQLNWKPPRINVPMLRRTKDGKNIDEANQKVIDIIKKARPTLVGMGIAKDVIDDYLQVEKTRRSHLTNAVFTQGKNEYWPIPQEYIDSVDDDLVTQNNGY